MYYLNLVSLRALRAYVIINSVLILLASFQYSLYLYTTSPMIVFSGFLLRNVLLCSFVELLVEHKPLLSSLIPLEQSNNKKVLELVQASILEHITYLCIHYVFQIKNTKLLLHDIYFFIPLSFVYEVIFDFFHYWTHRICHLHPWLYRHTHKVHHEYNIVLPHTTYHQHFLDIILTNSIPFLLTFLICPFKISLWQLKMILVYKEFVEISGHCGRALYPASSFPQFIWLPRMLHISLFAEDHHIHHTKRNINFGKRFSLWDKIFNTYQSGVIEKKKN